MGAEKDRHAPYNEPIDGESFVCQVTQTMVREAKVKTLMYEKDFMGYDEDGDAIVECYAVAGHPDESEFMSQYHTISELLTMLAKYVRDDASISEKRRKRLIEECEAWESEELYVES